MSRHSRNHSHGSMGNFNNVDFQKMASMMNNMGNMQNGTPQNSGNNDYMNINNLASMLGLGAQPNTSSGMNEMGGNPLAGMMNAMGGGQGGNPLAGMMNAMGGQGGNPLAGMMNAMGGAGGNPLAGMMGGQMNPLMAMMSMFMKGPQRQTMQRPFGRNNSTNSNMNNNRTNIRNNSVNVNKNINKETPINNDTVKETVEESRAEELKKKPFAEGTNIEMLKSLRDVVDSSKVEFIDKLIKMYEDGEIKDTIN